MSLALSRILAAFFLFYVISLTLQAQPKADAPISEGKKRYEEMTRCFYSFGSNGEAEKTVRKMVEEYPELASMNESDYLIKLQRAWRSEYYYKKTPKADIDKKYLDLLEFLAGKGAKPTEETLFDAAGSCHREMLVWCLDHGVDVKSKSKHGYTALHRIFMHKQDEVFECTKELVDRGADVNAVTTDEGKSTPIISAASRGDLKSVKYLVEHGAEVNVKDHYGRTPLFNAALDAPLETVRYLVENNAELNVAHWDGATPLSASGANPDTKVFRYLHEQGATYSKVHPVEYALRNFSTPSDKTRVPKLHRVRYFFEQEQCPPSKETKKKLFIAATEGRADLEIFQYLLDNGCDINGLALQRHNALFVAVNRGNLEATKFLLENGIDVNVRGGFGSPLEEARRTSEPLRGKLIKSLVEHGADIAIRDSLNRPPFEDKPESIQYLLDLGISPNQRDANGNTLLHQAAFAYGAGILQTLIDAKAEVNAKGANDATPLHSLAAGKFTMEKARILIKAGVDPNARDADGRTPLWNIVHLYRVPDGCLEEFKEWGADFTVKDKNDQTLLFNAMVDRQSMSTVDFLLAQMINLNAKDKNGRTALFYAAGQDGRPIFELVEHLVGKRAELDVIDSEGRTPLFPAVIGSSVRERTAKFLVERGLAVNHADKKGITPLMLAVVHSDPNEAEKMEMSSLPRHMYTEYELIKFLLAKGAEIDAKDSEGQTALDKADALGFARVAQLLRDSGAK